MPGTDIDLAATLLAGGTAVGVVFLLTFTARRWFTPIAEAVGAVAAVAFLVLGLRWSFRVLGDVYGD